MPDLADGMSDATSDALRAQAAALDEQATGLDSQMSHGGDQARQQAADLRNQADAIDAKDPSMVKGTMSTQTNTFFDNFASLASKVAPSIVGAGAQVGGAYLQSQMQPRQQPQNFPPQYASPMSYNMPQPSNTGMYIVAGVAGLGLLGAAIWFATKD